MSNQLLPIHNIEALRMAVQGAIELEHATIPPYLFALYSIKEGCNREVAALIQSIVIEEMLHMALMCNLLNAIGGSPDLNHPRFIPVYPGRLPLSVAGGLLVPLKACSLELIRDVFMVIEAPPQRGLPARQHQHSIHTAYQSIARALEQLDSEGPGIFTGDPARQLTRWLYPQSQLFPVTDLASALRAISEILEQGEGCSLDNPLHREGEPGHYFKFRGIAEGRQLVLHPGNAAQPYSFSGAPIPFDPEGVWPVMDNPGTQQYPEGSRLRILSHRFNTSYTHLLNALQKAFNGQPGYIDQAMGLMFALKLQALELMQTPVPGTDYCAGPGFEFVDHTTPQPKLPNPSLQIFSDLLSAFFGEDE